MSSAITAAARAPVSGSKKADSAARVTAERLKRFAAAYFRTAKANILSKLQAAIDFSPKGSIDEPVKDLVDFINSLPDLVTTSSCSGRIAVYTWTPSVTVDDEAASNKGAGTWQYVNHGEKGPLTVEALNECLASAWPGSSSYLKVEPLILHVQAASIESARRLLSLCMRAGYRESGIGIGGGGSGGGNADGDDGDDNSNNQKGAGGAVDLSSLSLVGKEKIIVAVRTTALSLEVPLRHHGVNLGTSDPDYLPALVSIANSRFDEVIVRRRKFDTMLRQHYQGDHRQHQLATAAALTASPNSATPAASRATPSIAVVCKDCGASFASKTAMFKNHLVAAAHGDEGKKVCPCPCPPSTLQLSTSAAPALPITTVPVPVAALVFAPPPTLPDVPASSLPSTCCSVCGLSFASRNQLFQHVADKHRKLDDNRGVNVAQPQPLPASSSLSSSSSGSPSIPVDAFGRALRPCDFEAESRASAASARLLQSIGWRSEEHGSDGTTALASNRLKAEAGQIPEPGAKLATTHFDSTFQGNKVVLTAAMSGWEQLDHSSASRTTSATSPSSSSRVNSIARQGHSAVVLSAASEGTPLIAVFGGLTLGASPTAALASSTSTASPSPEAQSQPQPQGRTNELLVFDAGSGGMVPVVNAPSSSSSSSLRPCPRTRHAAIALPFASSSGETASSCMLVHGGHSGPSKPLGDLWLLQVQAAARSEGNTAVSVRWSEAPVLASSSASCPPPSPRWGHSFKAASLASSSPLFLTPVVTAALEKAEASLYNHGGTVTVGVLYGGRDTFRSFDDLYLLLPVVSAGTSKQVTFLWVQVTPSSSSPSSLSFGSGSGSGFGQAAAAGPGCRYYHAAAVSSSFLVVHGGYRSPYAYGEHSAATLGADPLSQGLRAQLLGDCHVLCLESLEWLVAAAPSVPTGAEPRMSHSLVPVPLRVPLPVPLRVPLPLLLSGHAGSEAQPSGALAFVVSGGHCLEPILVGEELLLISLVRQPPATASFTFRSVRLKPTRPDVVAVSKIRARNPFPHSIPWPLRATAIALTSEPTTTSTAAEEAATVELLSLGGGGVAFAFSSHHSPSFRTSVTLSVKGVPSRSNGSKVQSKEEEEGSNTVGTGTKLNGSAAALAQLHSKLAAWLRTNHTADDADLIARMCPLAADGAATSATPVSIGGVVDGGGGGGAPLKVEWVGDVLVLPQGCMTSPCWSADAFRIVASQFGASRVARAAEIDPASKTRASGVQLLFPAPAPLPAAVATTSPWLDLDDESIIASCSGLGSQLPSSFAGKPVDVASETLCSAEQAKEAEGWLQKVKKAVHQASTALSASSTPTLSPGGWVKLKENGGLSYFFDLTKTMFSSGNINEKQRMAALIGEEGRSLALQETGGVRVLSGEVVVDLFAGIGYWALPLLCRARNIAFLHACDWNPHSIACLRMNLAANGVDPKRYQVWPGDNQKLLERAPHLLHSADRVLLGLIPSSEPWWPLALRLLKSSRSVAAASAATPAPTTAGCQHQTVVWMIVHQNVGEAQLDSGEWARSLTAKLRDLAAAQEKAENEAIDTAQGSPSTLPLPPLWSSIEVARVVRVKSFAPRVYHVVADVKLVL